MEARYPDRQGGQETRQLRIGIPGIMTILSDLEMEKKENQEVFRLGKK